MARTLTLDTAAELLNTHPDTVSDCIHNRGLPAARIGRSYVLIDDDVIAWLRTQYGNVAAWAGNAGGGGTTPAQVAQASPMESGPGGPRHEGEKVGWLMGLEPTTTRITTGSRAHDTSKIKHLPTRRRPKSA